MEGLYQAICRIAILLKNPLTICFFFLAVGG
jgi:hypothetical protein